MAKDTFYFSHDYNTRSDHKIKRLIAKHGMQGYGVFWSLIEDLYNNENTLPAQYDILAYDLRCSEELVESVINNFDLFTVNDENQFGSISVERRLNERSDKSKKARDNAMARWKKTTEPIKNGSDGKASAMQSQSDGNAIKENKVKESKVKESKDYKRVLLSEINSSDFSELNYDYVEIAKAFQLLFKKNLSEAGATTAIVDKAKGTWVDDIRLLIETDKYTIEDMRSVYEFLQTNSFWKKNILSTSKLREKIYKLKLELKNANNRTGSKEGTSKSQLAQVVAGHFSS
jgi:uncharacterized protein YdaU (DUF1376 family)